MDITCRKLEPADDTSSFDCGNAGLNDYLKKYARQDRRRRMGVTYAAVSCDRIPPKVVGYFTLANTSIPRAGLPEEMLRKIPRYQDLPAFLLGRLAVDRHMQGKRIGEMLLSRCFEHCLAIAQGTGARYLITDAIHSAVSWYERYNFRKIKGSADPNSVKMLVDLAVVESAIDLGRAAAP